MVKLQKGFGKFNFFPELPPSPDVLSGKWATRADQETWFVCSIVGQIGPDLGQHLAILFVLRGDKLLVPFPFGLCTQFWEKLRKYTQTGVSMSIPLPLM